MFLTKALNTATAELKTTTCRPRLRQVAVKQTHNPLDHAGSGNRGTDHKRRSDDDDDIVGESGKGFIVRDDPGGYGDQQGKDRNQVVAKLSPEEHRHHAGDDREGDGLLKCHGSMRRGRGKFRSPEYQ